MLQITKVFWFELWYNLLLIEQNTNNSRYDATAILPRYRDVERSTHTKKSNSRRIKHKRYLTTYITQI